jgi:hypothetical protein
MTRSTLKTLQVETASLGSTAIALDGLKILTLDTVLAS